MKQLQWIGMYGDCECFSTIPCQWYRKIWIIILFFQEIYDMKKILALFVFFSLLLNYSAKAQNNSDSLFFMQTMEKAEEIFSRKFYDSALLQYQKAYDWATQKKLLSYYSASNCLLALGDCFKLKSNYIKTQEYYYAALINARKYKHHSPLKNIAISALFKLHKKIQDDNIKFPYPVISNFSEQKVFFSISKILFQKGDSTVIEINAGTYDGVIVEKNKNAEIFSIENQATKIGGVYVGDVKVISSTGNKTIAVVVSMKDETVKVQPGWQVKLFVHTPDVVKQSVFNDAYRLNFNWQSNAGRLDIFNRRFLYYYADGKMDADIMDLFKRELKEVVDKWAPDTVNMNSGFRAPVADGIFKGKNIITAVHETDAATINYFIHFMAEFYSSYFGQQYKFSETYATWAMYNSLMNEKDINTYILGDEKRSEEMIQRASFMKSQVEKRNFTSAWVDEGLELVDKNYWSSLLSQSRLLYHYGVASSRKDCIAWSNFFDAVRLRSNGYINRSDSFLTASYKNFETAGSKEGMEWIQSVRSSVLDSSVVQLNIQRQHTMPYDVYPSPNQRYFATASKDYTIKIWDINLGKQIYTIDGHNDEVYQLAYNPGGRYLASISYDSTIKIWNTFNYGLMNSFKPTSKQRTIQFSPNGKYLVSAGYDSSVNFWDPFSGELIKSFRSPGGYVRNFSFYPKDPSLMYLVCTDSAVYTYRLDSIAISRVLKSNRQPILSFFFSNDGQYACYHKQDSTINIVNTGSGNIEYSERVYVWKSSGNRFFSDGAFSPDSRFFVFCRSDSNTVIVNINQRKSVGLYNSPVQQYAFNSNGNYFITHSANTPSIVDFSDFDFQKISDIIYGDIKFEDWKETFFLLKEKQFTIESQALLETRFAADNKSLFYLSWSTNKLDLTNGKTEILYPYHHWLGGIHQYPKDENLLIFRNPRSDDTLIIYHSKEKKIIASLSIPDRENISSFSFYDNDKYCILTGVNGGIACWNIASQKMLYAKKNIAKNGKALNSILVQPVVNRVIAFGPAGKPMVINVDNGSVLDSINLNVTDRAVFTNDKLFFTSDSGRLFYADPEHYTIKLVNTVNAGKNYFNEIKSSANGKFLYLLSAETCFVLETTTLQIINQFHVKGKNIINLSVSNNDSLLAIGSVNGEIYLYKPFNGELLSTVYFPLANEAVLTDNSGHYMASKAVLNSVVFSQGYKFFNYEQFDLQMNQPHKVLSAIGAIDTTTFQAYETAYQKRLQRNDSKDDKISTVKTPSIIILNRADFKPTTNKEVYTIEAECYDYRNKLTTLKVFVNDVPYKDTSNQWSNLDTTSRIFSIQVPLLAGQNKIKIYCTNKLGISSYKEVFDVYCTAKQQQQSTWFIGLGVNRYLDTANNLTYSVKDIRDLAKSFKKIYPDIIIDTLINAQVTLKNIELLKERLKKIKVTDRIIMAVTGHGLLSDSLDFYFATYDIDFKKPEAKGLKYDDLENILNTTAARQRLLLIDACHSGMLDKGSVVKGNEQPLNKDTTSGLVKVKNTRGLIVNRTQKLSEANSFSLMQNLFADFSNDNGIIVISAAGGLEYAFESEKWHNGVFTYCVIKGLEQKEADKESEGGNGDGKVSVQELMKYVSNKVPELTRGKQQPASRRENLEFDWIIK